MGRRYYIKPEILGNGIEIVVTFDSNERKKALSHGYEPISKKEVIKTLKLVNRTCGMFSNVYEFNDIPSFYDYEGGRI